MAIHIRWPSLEMEWFTPRGGNLRPARAGRYKRSFIKHWLNPYQPFPTKVSALANKKIVAISCGETHTLALTDTGHLYSFGANGCGQLGQFVCEFEKRRKESFEDVPLPKLTNLLVGDQYSFMSGA